MTTFSAHDVAHICRVSQALAEAWVDQIRRRRQRSTGWPGYRVTDHELIDLLRCEAPQTAQELGGTLLQETAS